MLNNPAATSELVDRFGNYHVRVELSDRIRGGNWLDGIAGPALVNTILPPGSPSLSVDGELRVDGFYSASINHNGGIVAAMLDGASRFVSKEIDCGDQTHPAQSAEELIGLPSRYGVWGSLGSANGGEPSEAIE